jgi:hypothetical protein
VCGYLTEPDPAAIQGIERTLFNTLLYVTGGVHFDILGSSARHQNELQHNNASRK